ncbi:MAG: hypothetical protein ACK40O_00910 [Allosphingosinicella sp.]
MSLESSEKSGKSQSVSEKIGEIAARFREERISLDPHQGNFAYEMGVKQGKLSSLETGQTELRATDLAAAAAVGIDVQYVVTGDRVADNLSDEASHLIDLYYALPKHMRSLLLSFAESMVRQSKEASEG